MNYLPKKLKCMQHEKHVSMKTHALYGLLATNWMLFQMGSKKGLRNTWRKFTCQFHIANLVWSYESYQFTSTESLDYCRIASLRVYLTHVFPCVKSHDSLIWISKKGKTTLVHMQNIFSYSCLREKRLAQKSPNNKCYVLFTRFTIYFKQAKSEKKNIYTRQELSSFYINVLLQIRMWIVNTKKDNNVAYTNIIKIFFFVCRVTCKWR